MSRAMADAIPTRVAPPSAPGSGASVRSRPAVLYLAGCLSTTAIFIALVVVAGLRTGFRHTARGLIELMLPGRSASVQLSKPVLRELQAMGAVIENANNPTKQPMHDTLLVRPDPMLGWTLVPNRRLEAIVLPGTSPLDLDPPVLYVPAGAQWSSALAGYIAREGRLRTSCSIDASGFRATRPRVESDRRILMVGDSVLFGVGVNDEATMASQLQVLVGAAAQIVNGGVGGYSGEQAFLRADALTATERYDALVYVACQNDFTRAHGIAYATQAQAVLSRFRTLKPRVRGRVAVLMPTYLQHAAADVLLGAGWPADTVRQIEALRAAMPGLAGDADLDYLDWASITAPYRKRSGTIFAPFALYSDQAHLSPLGNQFAAQALYAWLQLSGAI